MIAQNFHKDALPQSIGWNMRVALLILEVINDVLVYFILLLLGYLGCAAVTALGTENCSVCYYGGNALATPALRNSLYSYNRVFF